MAHELKIITEYTSKSHCPTIQIFVGDKKIGLIQNINFNASVDSAIPNIEITFPDLGEYSPHENISISGEDKIKNSPIMNNLRQSLHEYVKLLQQIPQVKLIFKGNV